MVCLIYSFIKAMSAYHVEVTFLDAWDVAVNKTVSWDQNFFLKP